MNQYRGFTYWELAPGLWQLRFPGGHKSPGVPLAAEDDVKKAIDDLIAHAAGM
jgi:hypothetical protein